MKHYTFSLLTFSLLTLTPQGSIYAKPTSYSIYTNCEEYYDSRGFYHKDCDNNKFSKRKFKKAYRTLTKDIEPGTGEEDNVTQEAAPLEEPTSAIDEIIEDNQNDDFSQDNEQEDEITTPAIEEDPELEFGREDP
jgi:hypothetical protein